jgi:hypothetical protein
VKRIIKATLWRCLNLLPERVRQRLLRGYFSIRPRDSKKVFGSLYSSNAWGSGESFSGQGSTLEYTESIRAAIPNLVRDYSIDRFLDAPCGDYNWFQHIKREPGFRYIGADVVPELIARNRALFESADTRFMQLDITRDPLPDADIWMCRDCLFHLSYRDIFHALANLLRSDIPLFLSTTHIDCTKNSDIATGSFRLINLQLQPFCLGEPIAEFPDWVEGHYRRTLALWRTKDMAKALATNRALPKNLPSPPKDLERLSGLPNV